MDPVSIAIGLAVISIAIFTTVFFAYLTFAVIVEWFQQYQDLVVNKGRVAFTLKEAMTNNQVSVIQGIFNPKTNEIEHARKIKADKDKTKIPDGIATYS
jgi:biopolymer transport protein ExbB/TolQ